MNKGQVPFVGIVITSILGLLGAIGTAWITSGAKITKEISQIDKQVAVVKTTEELHYQELRDLLGATNMNVNRIGDKLDKLIK